MYDHQDGDILWPVHCVRDTFGSELAGDLLRLGDEKNLKKVWEDSPSQITFMVGQAE